MSAETLPLRIFWARHRSASGSRTQPCWPRNVQVFYICLEFFNLSWISSYFLWYSQYTLIIFLIARSNNSVFSGITDFKKRFNVLCRSVMGLAINHCSTPNSLVKKSLVGLSRRWK